MSKTSSLAIVKIMNQYYLMSFSENSTEILQKLNSEEACELESSLDPQVDRSSSESLKPFDLKKAKEKFAHYFEKKR